MGDLRPGGGEVDPESNSECFLMMMINKYTTMTMMMTRMMMITVSKTTC